MDHEAINRAGDSARLLQGAVPSRTRPATRRIYVAALDDAAIDRCRARARLRANLLRAFHEVRTT